MMRPVNRVELADIFNHHAERYIQENTLTPEQHKVINAVRNCRTAVLGGHVQQCDQCQQQHIAYNSCRNRHCPKCQSFRTQQWLDDRVKDLLPVPYFHLVFTLPHELNQLILYNKKCLYSLLFEAAWETIKTLGADPNRLGGQMGMLSVLHTWGQNLSVHNHVHCMVPGGALVDGEEWKDAKKNFLFPVKVMSKLFRGIYVSKLRCLFEDEQLKLPETLSWRSLLVQLMKKDWVVYAKKPFAGPEKLLDYLGRYMHKIAIGNERILSCDEKNVTFKWRDYADNHRSKIMTLPAEEFIRRYLTHVVPSGFMRVRSFGFLANACRAKNIAKIRKILAYDPDESNKRDVKTLMLALTGIDITRCPSCHQGQLHVVRKLFAKLPNAVFDTS